MKCSGLFTVCAITKPWPVTNVTWFRLCTTVKCNRAETSLKDEQSVRKDELTFTTSACPSVSVLLADSTFTTQHASCNHCFPSCQCHHVGVIVSASLMFYFTWEHISLCLQGFDFKMEGRDEMFHICKFLQWQHLFRPLVSLLMTAVNYILHASVHWWGGNKQNWEWSLRKRPDHSSSFVGPR